MDRRSGDLLAVLVCVSLSLPALGQLTEQVERVSWGAEADSGSADGLAEKATFFARYDDGEADVLVKPGATTYEVAMLFENVGGPDVTLGGVEFCWRQTGGDPKIRYEVVIWTVNGGKPGTELAKFAAAATGVSPTPAFYGTRLTYPLTTSDVYIGVRYNPAVDPDFGFCLDTDGLGGDPAQRGYRRANETGAWSSISSIPGAGAYKALMVRALLSTPDAVAEELLVPYFLVDKADPGGTTTLFAVRNLTDDPVTADVEYFTRAGASQGTETLSLGPFETYTRNLRDVPGLASSPDGFARGYVEIVTSGNAGLTPVLAGDYFQVDVDDYFATGDKLARGTELCRFASLRFVEFPLPGSGTRLTVWIANPRGIGNADPPSFTIRVYDEDGNQVGLWPVKTGRHALELDASTYSTLTSGTLRFDFKNSRGGAVYAESSAEGRFSVGVSAQCDPAP